MINGVINDTVCQLDDNDYCVKHNVRHVGAHKKLALDSGAKGIKYRHHWDQLVARGVNVATGVHPSDTKVSTPIPALKPINLTTTCMYLGEQRNDQQGNPITVECPSCGKSKVKLKTFDCSIYGGCIQSAHKRIKVDELGNCFGCPDKSIPLFEDLGDPIIEATVKPLPKGWADQDATRDSRVVALHKVAKRVAQSSPPTNRNGTGVVICGGGRYWPMIVVSIQMLREVSDLPIQVWYRGEEEPIQPQQVAHIQWVTLHDATQVSPKPRILGGWECKTVAMLHSGLERILYLDADAYVVADPASILDLAEEQGIAFWGDLPHTNTNVKWQWYGLPPQEVPPVQGGQLILDLRTTKGWQILLLAHWINQHSDYFYRHQYGDQDSWKVAMALLGHQGHHIGYAPWKYPAFVCNYQDVDLIVHRCKAKMWGSGVKGTEGSGRKHVNLPKEDQAWSYLIAQYPDPRSYRTEASTSSSEVFGSIYLNNKWKRDPKEVKLEAEAYAEIVNGLIKVAGWSKIVDLGCGDGKVSCLLSGTQVVAVDCCADSLKFGTKVDLLDPSQRDSLPDGDGVLMKDVLQHWPNAAIEEFVGWAKGCGKWKWLVATNDLLQTNGNCILGGYRGLDPLKEPLADLGFTTVAKYHHKAITVLELAASPPTPKQLPQEMGWANCLSPKERLEIYKHHKCLLPGTDEAVKGYDRIKWLRNEVRRTQPPTMLEIGCHDGFVSRWAIDEPYLQKLVGIDPSEHAILTARRHLFDRVNRGKASYLARSYEDYIATERFHTVCAFELLEHLPRPEAMELLRFMDQATVPNGNCYISTPNVDGPHGTGNIDPCHVLLLDRLGLEDLIHEAIGDEVVIGFHDYAEDCGHLMCSWVKK